jgi:phosphate transport system substrate-binding protein
MRRILFVSFVIMALLLAACGGTEATKAPAPEPTEAPAAAGQLQLAGSTTVQPLAEKLAEAYMGMNAGLTIDVQGGGSSVGVTSAGEGTVDIGMASREIKGSEMEEFPELQVQTIAFDGIAIVTHPDVGLASLSVEQVRDIFAGEVTNFSEVGGPDADIVVVSREEGSGTRAAFEELVMAYKDAAGESQEKVIYERALLQQSNGQVRTTVASTPKSIGYLSFGFLDASTGPVPIDGAEPNVANVKNGSYPIFRPLNMLTNGAPSDLAQGFLDFILGADGQAIVAEDYITVK